MPSSTKAAPSGPVIVPTTPSYMSPASALAEIMNTGTEAVRSLPRTLSRTLLVFAGHPYSLDAAPAMEMIKWTIPLPEQTLSGLRACKTDLWLIPKGEKPFMMTGDYGPPVLPPVFSETFKTRYRKAITYKFFEVWACVR